MQEISRCCGTCLCKETSLLQFQSILLNTPGCLSFNLCLSLPSLRTVQWYRMSNHSTQIQITWQMQMKFHKTYKWNSFTNAIWTRSPVGWELVWPPCRRSIVSPQRGAGIWTVRTGSCSLITLFASPAQYGVWCCALPSTAEQAAFRDCEVDAKQAVDAVERREQWMPSRAALPTKEPFFSLSRWQAGATRYPLPPLLFKAPSSTPHNIYQLV